MRRSSWLWLCILWTACPKEAEKQAPEAAADAGILSLKEKEPNERLEQALTILGDATVSAALTLDPSRVDEDWYRLPPASGRIADVIVSGIPGSDVVLEIYDVDKNRLVAVNSGGAGQPERLPNLSVETERWVKIAAARKGGGGAYAADFRFRQAQDPEEREPNDRAADAHPLPLGSSVTAFIGHSGDEDWFRVELVTPAPAVDAGPLSPPPPPPVQEGDVAEQETPLDAGTAAAEPPAEEEAPSLALKIDLSPMPLVRPEITVLSAAEALLFNVRGKENEALSLRNVGVRVTDHIVYVVVKSGWVGTGKDAKRGFDAEAPYTLSVAVESAGAHAELEPNEEFIKATPMKAPGFKEGFLSPKGDVDHYVLRTQEPLLVKAQLSGVDRLDLMLTALEAPATEGAQPKVLLKANDGVLKEPEQLNNVLCNGVCYFRVEGAQRKVDGKWVKDFENAQVPYRLSLSAALDDGSEEQESNNTEDTATPLSLGKAVRGTVHPKKDVDYYKLDLSLRPVRTSLKATLLGILKVDVGLYLHRVDEEGKLELVQTSDRAKGELPETIRYSAEPGVYLLEVRDSKNRESNFQDSYQLTVEEG